MTQKHGTSFDFKPPVIGFLLSLLIFVVMILTAQLTNSYSNPYFASWQIAGTFIVYPAIVTPILITLIFALLTKKRFKWNRTDWLLFVVGVIFAYFFIIGPLLNYRLA